MGIKGLLKHIEDINKKINITDIKGSKVAIDGHSWMHKSWYNNGYEILINKNYNIIIDYIESKLNKFLINNVKIILVFDGDNHLWKKNTNKNRHLWRNKKKLEGFQSLMKKNKKLANKYFSESIDITPEFIYYICQFIKNKYKKEDVDFIIAPYEADSQLAYLNKNNIVDYIITEDSDLFLFGANDILFKMNSNYDFIYIKRKNVLKLKEFSTQENLIKISILSGCDYLPNPKGIGLKKSIKLFNEYGNINDIFNMVIIPKGYEIIENYLEEFNLAYLAFYYSIVYCPIKKKLVNLNYLDTTNSVDKVLIKKSIIYFKSLDFLGKQLQNIILDQHVYCEINPITKVSFKKERLENNSIIINKINIIQKKKEYDILKESKNLKNNLNFKQLIIADKNDYISDKVTKILDYTIKY